MLTASVIMRTKVVSIRILKIAILLLKRYEITAHDYGNFELYDGNLRANFARGNHCGVGL